jgi:hypothetical protein
MATRRLTVIQEPTGEDALAASRPAWHWVLIGSGLLVSLFLPLALAALALGRTGVVVRSLGAVTAAGLAAGAAFALASALAGYLMARFGPRTRRRHAVFAGLSGAAGLWCLVLFSGGFQAVFLAVSTLFMLAALGAAFCVLGARLHRRKKSAV